MNNIGRQQSALRWIKKHIPEAEFRDDEVSTEEMMDWYAHEIALFSASLAPKTAISTFIRRNYTPETFFIDHEHVADRYYGN